MKILILLIILLTGCGGAATTDDKPELKLKPAIELVAHRGIGEPDNTIESFTNALNLGFTSLETDLRMQGGKVVLAHDKTIDDHEYLSLEDFLIFASNTGAKIWIEAKETKTIKPALDLLKRHNLDIVFISFRQTDVDLIKSLSPETSSGLIIDNASQIDNANADWAVISMKLLLSDHEKAKHLKIAAWTITGQQQYNDIEYLIDAAITDVQITQ